MGKHLRTRYSAKEVQEILARYLPHEIGVETIDPYGRISFHTLRFAIHGVPIREEVELWISCHRTTRMARIRFWYRGRLVGQQEVKTEDLPKVHF